MRKRRDCLPDGGDGRAHSKEHGEKGYLKMEDGMSIAYRRYFCRMRGKCVVISTGFANSRKNITKSHTVFCRRDTRSMCRNTGDTGIPGARWMTRNLVHVQSYDCYAADLARFVETVEVPGRNTGSCLQHSMGGAIAILALERYPQLFEAAVLSAPMCAMQTGKYPRFLAKTAGGVLLSDRKRKMLCHTGGTAGLFRDAAV